MQRENSHQRDAPIRSDFIPRRPDFNVAALDKETGRKGQVGAAWINEDGTISIKFNFLVLIDMGQQDLSFTLFPVTQKER